MRERSSSSERPSPSDRSAPPAASSSSADQTRINEMIRVPTVRLIGGEGNQIGIVSIGTALDLAVKAGMDLVEVAPEAKPPVCKIMDYSKFKYQKALREREARRKQTRIEIKEVKFRPATDDHDFDVKLRSMRKFFEEGDKVKCTIRFRGREMAHQDLGMAVLKRVETELQEVSKMEQEPKMMGKQITMVLAPLPAKGKKGEDAATG